MATRAKILLLRQMKEQKINQETEQGENKWLGKWLENLERPIIEEGRQPPITPEDAQRLAKCFEKAVNWGEIDFPPPAPEKKTETPVNKAREEGLRRVFPGISPDIDWLTEKLAELRRKTPKTLEPLRKGVVEVLADLTWLAWAQSQKPELAEGTRKILAFSLAARITKGKLRKDGLCSSLYQGHLLYAIRGLRDLPPGSLLLIGEFLEHQLEANRLMAQIIRAEQLRVGAVKNYGTEEETFDDEMYRQALDLMREQTRTYEEKATKENWRDWPSRLIAAVAHAYLMAATIEQSRAKHTLQTKEKRAAIERAAGYYKRLSTIAEELKQRDFLYTADGSGFIWPVETRRNQARLAERKPDATENDYEEAAGYYQQAVEQALALYQNPQLPKKVRNAALMAAGTARVEKILALAEAAKKRGEIPEQNIVEQEFLQALKELTEAWDAGYHNEDRLRASLDRMLQLIRQHHPGSSLETQLLQAYRERLGGREEEK